MFKIKKEDINPICPYCEKQLNELIAVSLKALVTTQYMYCCEHCHKVLGMNLDIM